MWLTNTYLEGPKSKFPVYGYLWFNPYTTWDDSQISSLREKIAKFGRNTKKKMAFYAPATNSDMDEIGTELSHRFGPLVEKFGWIDVGVFFVDIPLEDVCNDGSNSKYCLVKFEKNLNIYDSKYSIDRLFSDSSEIVLNSQDPVQEIALKVIKNTRPKISDAFSIGLGGPTINISHVQKLLRSQDFISTNIWN